MTSLPMAVFVWMTTLPAWRRMRFVPGRSDSGGMSIPLIFRICRTHRPVIGLRWACTSRQKSRSTGRAGGRYIALLPVGQVSMWLTSEYEVVLRIDSESATAANTSFLCLGQGFFAQLADGQGLAALR